MINLAWRSRNSGTASLSRWWARHSRNSGMASLSRWWDRSRLPWEPGKHSPPEPRGRSVFSSWWRIQQTSQMPGVPGILTKQAARRLLDVSTIQLCLRSLGSVGLQATVVALSCGWAFAVERKVDLEAVIADSGPRAVPAVGESALGQTLRLCPSQGDTDIPRDAQPLGWGLTK